MYWIDRDLGCLGRSNLDGTAVTTLVDGLPFPEGIALDLSAGKLYWGAKLQDTIWRADLDGSDSEPFITTGVSYPYGLLVIPEPAAIAGLALFLVLGARAPRR